MSKDILRDPLYFTRKERMGIVSILILCVIIYSIAYFTSLQSKKAEQSSEADPGQIAALLSLQQDTSSSPDFQYASDKYPYQNNSGYKKFASTYEKENMAAAMFVFDPNALTIPDWQRLGVREKTATSIQKYIAAGGRFRSPEDLKKIWGLSPEKAAQLVPYARISEQDIKKTYTPFPKDESSGYKPYERKVISPININESDTTAWDNLPGIGAGYAGRITRFRDKLGGFYSIDQVAETFGLPDSVFQKIKPYLKVEAGTLRKINLNSATEEELKNHPYIRWQLAKIITAYRTQHGNFKQVSDLQNIMVITPEQYAKMSPYLMVQ